jgi:hypothetical protein
MKAENFKTPAFVELLERMLRENLKVQRGERIVFVSDTAPFAVPDPKVPDRSTLCSIGEVAAKSLGLSPRTVLYPPTREHGKEPPQEVFSALFPRKVLEAFDRYGLWKKLYEKTLSPREIEVVESLLREHPPEFEVLVSFSAFSITHTRFRRFLTSSEKVRIATMPGVEPRMFFTVMQADWEKVRNRSLKVAELMSSALTAEILSPFGHTFRVSLEGRAGVADTGIISEPGMYGNLPGGEGFIAPVEGTAEGEIACGPPSKPEERLLRFEGGRIVEIVGPPSFRDRFHDAFARYPLASSLCELGVGTNERAEDVENILEAEKILGTAHIAVGDNLGFGGTQSVPFHQDVVIFHPTLNLLLPSGPVQVLNEGTFLLE